ncbi:MAG: hypothetical protein LBO21_04805 [Synergistaceae bacterium]|jgi:hypothetical protein|nr:hypothetical protein [Synergistaceae bacterium]
MRRKKITMFASSLLSAALFLMCASSSAWAALPSPFSLYPSSHVFLILGENTYWTAYSLILAEPQAFYEYDLSLTKEKGVNGEGSVTIGGGMRITLDEANHALRLNGPVTAETEGVIWLHATNLDENAISFDVPLSVSPVSTDLTGNKIDKTRLTIYDSSGNLQDKSTYIVPDQASSLVLAINGTFDRNTTHVMVSDPSGAARSIPDNTNNLNAVTSDGYRFVGSNLEIWYTPPKGGTGIYTFTVYYTLVERGLYHLDNFDVEGEIPGGKEGGCYSGIGALAVLAALPVLLGMRRKKRQ